jgi:hypothetical protein
MLITTYEVIFMSAPTVTVSFEIESEIKEYLHLTQETLRRWEEAQHGKVMTNEAVNVWLDIWGTDAKGARPSSGS